MDGWEYAGGPNLIRVRRRDKQLGIGGLDIGVSGFTP